MPTGVGIALAVGSVAAAGAGVASARQGRKAAEAQGEANRREGRNIRDADERRAEETRELLEGIAFNPVNPLDFEEDGFRLSERATEFAREILGRNREASIGGDNLGAFDRLKSRLVDESNFEFGGEFDRVINTSALSRTAGSGVIGAAERLASDQRFAFGRASRGDLLNLLNFETRFQPAPPNPLATTFDLANFEFRNRQAQTNLELNKAGIGANSINASFQTQKDFFESQAANDPAVIGFTGAQNQFGALSQSLAGLGSSFSSLATEQRTANSLAQTNRLQAQIVNDRRADAGRPPIDFSSDDRSLFGSFF